MTVEEVEKNPTEKKIDIAKRLGLPSTLNTIIATKKETREHAYMSVDQELVTCGVLCVEEMCGELGSRSCMEVQVVVVVVMTMKPNPNQCQVLWKHYMLTTSLEETKQTSLMLKVYSSI
jgi:hypothetical protein